MTAEERLAELDLAERLLSEVTNGQHADASDHHAHGEVLERLCKYDLAVTQYDKARSLDPSSFAAAYRGAIAYGRSVVQDPSYVIGLQRGVQRFIHLCLRSLSGTYRIVEGDASAARSVVISAARVLGARLHRIDYTEFASDRERLIARTIVNQPPFAKEIAGQVVDAVVNPLSLSTLELGALTGPAGWLTTYNHASLLVEMDIKEVPTNFAVAYNTSNAIPVRLFVQLLILSAIAVSDGKLTLIATRDDPTFAGLVGSSNAEGRSTGRLWLGGGPS